MRSGDDKIMMSVINLLIPGEGRPSGLRKSAPPLSVSRSRPPCARNWSKPAKRQWSVWLVAAARLKYRLGGGVVREGRLAGLLLLPLLGLGGSGPNSGMPFEMHADQRIRYCRASCA